MGGKFRQGRVIAHFAKAALQPGDTYVEPFCGALGSAHRVAHPKMMLSDTSEAAISFWKAVHKHGVRKVVPKVLTERMYDKLKAERDPKNPLTFFAGFGLAFGARYFAAYAPNHLPDPVGGPAKMTETVIVSVEKKLAKMAGCQITWACQSYETVKIPPKAVVYLDPPYQDRARAHDFKGGFDYDAFWAYAARLSARIPVLVTEFTVPKLGKDWKVLHNWGDTINRPMGMAKTEETTIDELLVCHKDQWKAWKQRAS